jgi:hypothetical protein
MKRLAIVIALSGLFGAPSVFGQGAPGKNHVRSDPMTGYQEAVPPPGPGTISSTGTGEFVAEIDDEAMTITYELTYADLEPGPATQAHIHFGARGTTGGVSAFLCGGGSKPPCPAVPGTVTVTVTGVITAADIIGPAAQGIDPAEFADLVRAIRSGVTYVNVHSARWPTGEIRGQINDRNERQVK